MRLRAPIFLAAAAAFFLSACGLTPGGSFAREAVLDKGGEAYDEGLVNAEAFMCQVASVGSVQRRYGGSMELAQAWRALCRGNAAASVEIIIAPDAQPLSAPMVYE